MRKRILALLLALALPLCGIAALAEAYVDGCEAVTDDLCVEYGYEYSDPDGVALKATPHRTAARQTMPFPRRLARIFDSTESVAPQGDLRTLWVRNLHLHLQIP